MWRYAPELPQYLSSFYKKPACKSVAIRYFDSILLKIQTAKVKNRNGWYTKEWNWIPRSRGWFGVLGWIINRSVICHAAFKCIVVLYRIRISPTLRYDYEDDNNCNGDNNNREFYDFSSSDQKRKKTKSTKRKKRDLYGQKRAEMRASHQK